MMINLKSSEYQREIENNLINQIVEEAIFILAFK